MNEQKIVLREHESDFYIKIITVEDLSEMGMFRFKAYLFDCDERRERQVEIAYGRSELESIKIIASSIDNVAYGLSEIINKLQKEKQNDRKN